MKNFLHDYNYQVLVFVVFLSINNAITGQVYQSIFADDTTKWIVFNCVPDAGETIGYFTYSDTVIDHTTWHVLHREILLSPEQPLGFNSTVCGYIREDTINGKCWFLSPDRNINEETIFLDFDLEEGAYMKFITDYTSLSVDSALVVDVTVDSGKKIITLDKYQFHCNTEDRIQFIEGIGATNGFYLAEPLEPSEVHMLACKFENSDLVYSSTYGFGNCFLSSDVVNRNVNNEEYFHVYPNPSCKYFNIELDPEILPVSYHIYNTDGCSVKRGEMTLSYYTFDLENPGIYYFEIYNNHFRSVKKIIQTNH